MKPYEGKANYAFASYAHIDHAKVMPIIERLMHENVRIWYDSGIEPGDLWSEVIGEKVSEAHVVIAFLSEQYFQSVHCQAELQHAFNKKIPLICVFLEEITLSPGWEMQLSLHQHDYLKHYTDEQNLIARLKQSPNLLACLKEADTNSEDESITNSESDTGHQKAGVPGTPHVLKWVLLLLIVAVTAGFLLKWMTNRPGPEETAVDASPHAEAKITEIDPHSPIVIQGQVCSGNESDLMFLSELSEEDLQQLARLDSLETLWLSEQEHNTDFLCRTLREMPQLKEIRISDSVLHNLSFHENLEKLSLDNIEGIEELTALNQLPNLTALMLNNCRLTDQMLADVHSVSEELERLHLSSNEKITVVPDFVEGLSELKFVYIDNTSVGDITVIANLPNLYSLNAGNCSIRSIPPLKSKQINHLDLSRNVIEDISALRTLSLSTLRLNDNHVSDVSPLAGHHELVGLDISDNQIDDISMLSFDQIMALAAGNNQIKDFSSLDVARALIELDIRSNPVDVLPDFAKLKNIRALNLKNTNLPSLEPILPLAETLKKLNVSNNALNSLTGIEKFSKLCALSLMNNEIRSLEDLVGLSSLEYLDVSYNQITDIEPLAPLENLETLNVSNNMIENIDVLNDLPKVKSLAVHNNQIKHSSVQFTGHMLFFSCFGNPGDDTVMISGRMSVLDAYLLVSPTIYKQNGEWFDVELKKLSESGNHGEGAKVYVVTNEYEEDLCRTDSLELSDTTSAEICVFDYFGQAFEDHQPKFYW